MGRELLLTLLVLSLGGAAQQFLAWLPPVRQIAASAADLERRAWLRLWYPMIPPAAVTAWLVGWALTQTDPVSVPVGDAGMVIVCITCVPFGLVLARALLRTGWSLLRRAPEAGVSTVGLVLPHSVFSPFLAKTLDHDAIEAALAHEAAHARNRDPLRIGIAQLITGLQWPWPQARARLESWLDALEMARDEEAREAGTDGQDLAAAVLATARFLQARDDAGYPAAHGPLPVRASLTGDAAFLRERVARLLAPLPEALPSERSGQGSAKTAIVLLAAALLGSLTLGLAYGGVAVHLLLAASL